MQLLRWMSSALMLALIVPAAWPQIATKANEGYKTPEGRNGVAATLDSPDRETSQKPRELLTEINIAKGSAVADIGTGVGYMLPFLSEAVGPQGKVYGEDIFPEFLDKAKDRVAKDGLKNVQLVAGTEKDVKLPAGALDLAFVLDVYHHFNYPADTLASIAKALKADGRLVIVDFYRSRKHPRMTPERLQDHIRLDRDGFVKEIESSGYKLDRTFDHLPHQYVIIFKKK